MKILIKLNLVVLVLLSLSSGVTKILLMPQEVEFFGGGGFSSTWIVVYGAAQLVGGILLILAKTRLWGGAVMVFTFGVSTILIFLSGKIGFGLFSLLPVVMSIVAIIWSARDKSAQRAEQL
jgi:hypothetical protein